MNDLVLCLRVLIAGFSLFVFYCVWDNNRTGYMEWGGWESEPGLVVIFFIALNVFANIGIIL